ncbi:23S rRNA (cytidine1920-2'-O)/16S rRNA (cytidine1409-2'-O)-methyltransferase [Parvibaculum indicum]|uniref:TlyA family RNA methyltransferase n=1 Tax=Parvibaculum indicum TaxID=562969 RepID=UPI00141F0563|nr:TlyA family RNA methyltransferase [Parvibaculum indicum]NIJ42590.1 23S rRNA (cytidine1920-2'-O)/16S rRNA (cytidine1409-2'-O)-methyltransferase [Parvibaculum indicum]
MQTEKCRLDQALVERGLAPSRARAQGAIRAGHVSVNGRTVVKPAAQALPSDEIDLSGLEHPYVSRAALKLVHGLDRFAVAVAGRHALDLGASTGGFTQVLLERDAAHVIAIDVGHGQLDESLRRDPRVTAIEGLNTKDIGAETVSEPFDLIVCDLSFISLKKALPAALSLAPSGADLIALIKPQFEVGKGRLGRGGVVKEEGLHEEVCADIAEWLSALPGWTVTGITPSPIEGGDGNREFLIAAHHD